MKRAVFTALLLIVAAPLLAEEAPSVPSWQCLPERTVFALRVPAGCDIVEKMRQRTQLGKMLFDAQRWEKLMAIGPRARSRDVAGHDGRLREARPED